MALVRRNPFRELEEMQARVNRLFDEVPVHRASDEGFSVADWSPAVDIQETDKEYLIKADLPEVNEDNLKVGFLDGSLTIEGERTQEKEERGKRFREYWKFARRFTLPSGVDASKVQAEFKEGVLNVRLPKAPTAKPKSIAVKGSWRPGSEIH